MPDFEARSSASFISSKEGGIPASFSRSWMKSSNSCCLRVSIALRPGIRAKTKQEQSNCSICVPQLQSSDCRGSCRAEANVAFGPQRDHNVAGAKRNVVVLH